MRAELAPFRPSACACVCPIYQSRGSILLALGRKVSLKATRNLRLCFWDLKIFCTWWLSPHCLLSLNIGTFSVIFYKGFRSKLIDLGAGTIFGDVGVSDLRAEMPIKKFKTISNGPNQGSSSVAFTNASVMGCAYMVCSQPAASAAVCASAWRKKNKIKKKTKTTDHPPVCGQKCQGDSECFPKGERFCTGGSGAREAAGTR